MMALKGGHCSETEERERELLEGLFTVKIRRGRSPGVPRLHVSRLSTHEEVKGSRGALRKPESSDLKLEMSSGIK